MNYHNKRFRPVQNTENGETSAATLFHYQQTDNIVTCTYSGGAIVHGHLIALVDEAGGLDMRYHQVNTAGELRTGRCRSTPEYLADGRLRLLEEWEWTSGDGAKGRSILEELQEDERG